MAAEWFYLLVDQQFGPVSAVEIRALAAAGTITPDMLIRKGADGRWLPARQVQGLFQPSGSRPAQAAPLSDTKPTGRATVPLAEQKSPVPPPLPANHIPTAGASGKLAEDRSDNRGRMFKPVPYSIIFAWGWTLFIGYIELFGGVHSPQGPVMLRPWNLPILFAGLLGPVLILVGPTFHIIRSEWRKTKSPAILWLIGIIAVVILGQVAQVCRPPDPLSTFGWSRTSAARSAVNSLQREEARQATSRLEDRFSKMVEPGLDQSGAVARGDSRSEKGAKSHGVVGEVEQWITEYMGCMAELGNDYRRELKTIGWNTILDPTRLHNDKTLTESRAILSKAREVVQRYRAKQSSLSKTTRLKLGNLNIGSNLKQEMLQSHDKSAKTWQLKMDRVWDLEKECVGEVENMLNLLEAKSGSWAVVKGEIIFHADQDAEKYNAFLSNIQRYATEEEKIRKEAVDATKAVFAGMKEGL